MAATAIRSEERIGLVVAVAAHVAVVGLLVLRPSFAPVFQPPQRIEVTLSDNVGLTSTSPEPNANAAPDIAPELGEPEPQPRTEAPPPRPEPQPQPQPQPAPRPLPRAAAPAPKPAPQPKPAPPRAAPKPTARQAPTKPGARAGGSRVGSDFLEGVRGAQSTGTSRNAPAAEIGPAVRSSLAGSISRQLKPRWSAPQGPDAQELVTILAWNLNPDGSLDGAPRVVNQLGVNDTNRAQAGRHAEQAIRAVQLAAPFDLPSEYYDAWKRITAFRFDKRLSQ